FFQAEDGIRDRTVTGVQTCALPISHACEDADGRATLRFGQSRAPPAATKHDEWNQPCQPATRSAAAIVHCEGAVVGPQFSGISGDRKSTRLNSSHRTISYAVFCLKK